MFGLHLESGKVHQRYLMHKKTSRILFQSKYSWPASCIQSTQKITLLHNFKWQVSAQHKIFFLPNSWSNYHPSVFYTTTLRITSCVESSTWRTRRKLLIYMWLRFWCCVAFTIHFLSWLNYFAILFVLGYFGKCCLNELLYLKNHIMVL